MYWRRRCQRKFQSAIRSFVFDENYRRRQESLFRYYQEHILIPGINLQRKKYCNFDITAGTTIPAMVTAVAWCDIRPANVPQESYQRLKCLTHLHQVDLHLEGLQTIKSKEIQKKTTANMKHEERGRRQRRWWQHGSGCSSAAAASSAAMAARHQ